MFKLNRVEIRKVLNEYRQAEKEYRKIHSKIMNDTEVKELMEKDQRKARKFIRNNFPELQLIKNKMIDKGIKLVEIMKKGVNGWEKVEADKAYFNESMFSELLKLAEEV